MPKFKGPCIYCGRSEEQHPEPPALITEDMPLEQRVCLLGYTSREELDAPNFITQGIASECLKDLSFSMQRAMEVLTQMGRVDEVQELQKMAKRIDEMQRDVYSEATATFDAFHRNH